MNILQAQKALRFASPSRPVLFIGPPGVGKSDIVAQFAAENNQVFLVEHPSISEPVDYKGLPGIVDGNAIWLPLGQLKQITKADCPPTVVLADDLGQATPATQAAWMQLFLARKLGDFNISPNVTFLACSNRPSDNSGVRSILSALINRVMLIEISADAKVWADWALRQPEINEVAPAYARFRPDLFASALPTDLVAYCTPRSFAQLGRLISDGATKDDFELWAGLVGKATASDVLAYQAVFGRLPDIDAILANPRGWKVPKADPGLMHAVTVSAARRGASNPAGLIGLAEHIGTEWGVALVSDTCVVEPEFKRSREFQNWAVKHKDVLL